ncbi:aminopeptidase [Halodesulfovibrio aestuarii]|uniref:aminopeptidase n=1 Tax=Halodesulfovibrio aestuarii TaxID=126333 RepID=UPI00352262B9
MSSDTLSCEPKSCWEVYNSESDLAAMDSLAARYVEFLSTCKTERETIAYAVKRLEEAGFSTDISSGKYYTILHDKTLFVARKGTKSLAEGVHLVGAHADTPRIDFKQHPLYETCGVAQAKTHYYGGIRKYQWLSRPLALHGVVVKEDGERVIVNIGEDASDPVFTIADLLPHLAQDQSKKVLSDAFDAEKLNIILAHRPVEVEDEESKDAPKEKIKQRVLNILHDKYGINEEDLYSSELQAVPAGSARMVGLDESIIGGYGQDDRICCFTALEALIETEASDYAQVIVLWDKEEIGSEGSTGAKSRFFEYCIEDLIEAWDPNVRFRQVMLATRALSSDVHGAMDPDYQEVHEKLNSATLGYGPCFCKFTGHRGKYEANDAHPEYLGWLRGVMNSAGVPWQMAELGKVDHGGGGTVAMYLAMYGMNIVDFGPGLLAMHSPFELASKADLYATMKAFSAFLEAK